MKTSILISVFLIIFSTQLELRAESLNSCNAFHLPSNKIRIDKIDKDKMTVFMNAIWNNTTNRHASIASNYEKEESCWRLGGWKDSLCFEPLKLYEKLINNERYVFLLLGETLDSNQQGCWSANNIDCFVGASRAGSGVIGIFSFKKIGDEFVEPTGYSGLCESSKLEVQDINLEQNGANSYIWTIKNYSDGQGETYITLFMVPAFNEFKSSPYNIANFVVEHDNFGDRAPFEEQKIDYGFIKGRQEFYDLSLRFFCRKYNEVPNMINDKLEGPKLIRYPVPLLSKYSYKTDKYILPKNSDKFSNETDLLDWFRKRAKCKLEN